MSLLGELIRGHRQGRGLSERELAERVPMSPSWLSYLELGARAGGRRPVYPSRILVEGIAAALGLRAGERDALLIAAGYTPDWLAAAVADGQLLYRLWAEVRYASGEADAAPRRVAACRDCGRREGPLRRGYCRSDYLRRWRRGEFKVGGAA
jgi:transcriptional regulator with XRE-family HTH domain